MFRLVVLFATLAAIQAQYITPALTSQSNNIYRTFGNLGQVSTHSKTIDTPFSSVSKSDVRVSNPGLAVGGYGLAHGVAPLGLAHAGLAPYGVAHAGLAPYGVAHAGLGPYGVAHAPIGLHAGYAAPLGVAHAVSPLLAPRLAVPRPVYAPAAIAKPIGVGVAPAGLLGVAYSAAPAVAHMSYSNGLGISYTW